MAVKFRNIKLQFYRSIYSRDSIKSIQNKYNNINGEYLKEHFIPSFLNATELVKEIL